MPRKPKGEKKPYNDSERLAWERLIEKGWEVTKLGWPDFACFRDGKLILIEVKASRSRRLKYHQLRLMKALAAFGVPCYRWDPDTGFDRISPMTMYVPSGPDEIVKVGAKEYHYPQPEILYTPPTPPPGVPLPLRIEGEVEKVTGKVTDLAGTFISE